MDAPPAKFKLVVPAGASVSEVRRMADEACISYFKMTSHEVIRIAESDTEAREHDEDVYLIEVVRKYIN